MNADGADPVVLGIDLGTGSAKALLLDAQGHELSVAAVAVPSSNPRPGWAESSPEDWWGAVKEAVGKVVGPDGQRVAAIGLSGQMHGVVLTTSGAEPVRPAILWLDRRAEASLEAYLALPPEAAASLGNPFVPGMAGPILHWLAQREPASLRSADFALQPKDWLRLRMVGRAGSEPSDASGTLLFDIFANTWQEEVARALGVPPRLLAPLGRSDEVAGPLTSEAASQLGLPGGLPVAFGSADTAASLVGSGLVEPGPVQLTVGSGAQVVTVRDQPRPDPALRYHVFASALRDRWYALAAVQAAGVAISWALEAFGATWDEAYELFDDNPGSTSGPIFLPHLAGARSPSMDFRARGVFAGLQLQHDRADLLRSVFEGVAFSVREAAEALPEFAASDAIYLAGGGSTRPQWRQLLADVLDKRLLVLGTANASAKGAAFLAARAIGALGDGPGQAWAEAGREAAGEVQPDAMSQRPLLAAYQRWLEAGPGAVRALP